MFSFNISGTKVVFSKFFNSSDKEAVLASVEGAKGVVFLDTGATPVLAETIEDLFAQGVEVYVRDHHRGEGRTPEAVDRIEEILACYAKIVTRAVAPACAQLVELGEFASGRTVIVADPDLDGLTAAMKAAGVTYEGLDEDAGVFDERPRQSAETLTSLGWTAVRGLSTLPPFNPDRPQASEDAKKAYFETFVAAAAGDEAARADLETRVAQYEEGVAEAKRLLGEKVSYPCKGVAMVDSVGADRPDLNTMTSALERGGAIVTVVRKNFGPIAGLPGQHGIQFSMAVARNHQKELDLRDLVPEGMESSPQAGLLSNTSFLLHCSEKVWSETILPALRERLAGAEQEAQ